MPGDVSGTPRLRFGRGQRLQQGWEFERTRKEGQRLAKGCLILNWRIGEGQNSPRLGVITSRKIGGAIVRSRARRVLREAFRLHQHELVPADIVLVARNSIAGKNRREVEKDFLSAAKQAGLLRKTS